MYPKIRIAALTCVDVDPKHHFKKRGRGQWSRSTVHGMLKNETYAGVWRYGKTMTQGGKRHKKAGNEEQIAVAVPSIVPRETWEQPKRGLTKTAGTPQTRGGGNINTS